MKWLLGDILTFEHRHQNKSCSACAKDNSREACEHSDTCIPGSQLLSDFQNFQLGTSSRNSKLTGGGPKKHMTIFDYKQRFLSIDMKTKIVQHVPRIIFNVFKVFKFSSFQVFNFSKFSGSQRPSDFQTFLFSYLHTKIVIKFEINYFLVVRRDASVSILATFPTTSTQV